MTFLPDHELHTHGPSLVQPFFPECVGPASIDLHLSEEFAVPDMNARLTCVDLEEPVTPMRPVIRVKPPDGFVLHPGEFVLGVTQEIVTLPDYIVGRIEGKSSLGRIGLMVHVTAGFIDPGFCGAVTLQMTNVLRIPIILRPGKKICQITFAYMNAPCDKPYQGRYQNTGGVVAAQPEVAKQ